MRRPWASLAPSLLLCACAGLDRGPRAAVVEAAGQAPLSAGKSAREQALIDAQRRAVEKAAGVWIASTQRVENGTLTRGALQAAARGRIRRYRVVREGTRDGFYEVSISAVVDEAPDENEAPAPEGSAVALAAGGALIREPLAQADLQAASSRNGLRVDPAAPLVLKATGNVWPQKDARLGALKSARARLELRAETASGQAVWSAAQEASAVAADDDTAGKRALELAADEGGRRAAEGLSKWLWTR